MFILSKELLKPMKPLAESLHGRLNEVYFAFKKVDEITSFYHQLRSNVETEHRRAYAKAKQLAEDVDSEESVPWIVHGRQKRSNPIVTNPEHIGELQ